MIILLVSWRLLKDSGISLNDVSETSETILGLDISPEQRCRSREPVAMAEDFNVKMMSNVLISNVMVCLVTLILLIFEGFSCEPFISQ